MPSEHLTQNEIDAASLVRWEEFNSQNQPKVTWPTSIVVARAYLDQLKRSKAVTGGPGRRDRRHAGSRGTGLAPRPGAPAAATDLTSLAAELERDAGTAAGRDAARLRALAETVKGRAAQLR